MNVGFWRKWHRWIAWPASLFLLFASGTGVVLAITERFGEAEAEREAARFDISPVKVGDSPDAWMQALAAAVVAAQDSARGAPLDKIELHFKGTRPAIHFYTGRPEGGEDRKLSMDLASGKLIGVEHWTDKPFLNRLHSGEALGDGGLMVAMLWGTALFVVTVTGLVIYWRMRRPGAVGAKRVFW
jgi:uncharacterized iron-regulated membrane protein